MLRCMFVVLLAVWHVQAILSKTARISSAEGCNYINSFYEDMGCKPMMMKSDPCPIQYDCSHLKPKSKNQCFFQGNLYTKSKRIPKEVTDQLCMFDCMCRDDSKIECAQFDCPEFSMELPDGCYHSYGRSCCPERVICENATTTSCSVDGETYLEGAIFYPKKDPCMECVCSPGFKGELVEPFCKRVKCPVQKEHFESFMNNCAPLYGKSQCCIRKFKCPEPNERIVRSSRITALSAGFTCQYGKELLRIGDHVELRKQPNITCECITPPLVTCTSQRDYEFD